MNGKGYRDPTADRAIRNAGRLQKPIWNVVKAVREVLNVSHLELVEIRMRDRTTGREHKWGGDTNGEKGSGAVHRRMRADQRDGKDIRRLKKKRQTIVQTNVSGSNPDFRITRSTSRSREQRSPMRRMPACGMRRRFWKSAGSRRNG